MTDHPHAVRVGHTTSRAIGFAVAFSIGLAAGPGRAAAPPGGYEFNGRWGVIVDFDALSKKATNDSNRIDAFIPNGDGYPNYAAVEPADGPNECHDPEEFFGQAIGYPDATQPPLMVTGGERATWTSTYNYRFDTITAKTYTGLATCPGVHLDGTTRTIYSASEFYFEALKVERTFVFHPGLGVVANTGLRAFVPRIISRLHFVLLPNASGKVVTYDANNCTTAPCTVTDWNGTWFADDYGDGQGVLVIRAPTASSLPAFVGIQSGGLSSAKFTSIVLSQPSTGWPSLVTETEYLCVYDQRSWDRSTTLPEECLPNP